MSKFIPLLFPYENFPMMISLFYILAISSFLLNTIYAVDKDIDLNQPASPEEEWPTTEMSRPIDQEGPSINQSKTDERKLRRAATQRRYIENMKKNEPEKHKALLKYRSDWRTSRFKQLDEKEKKENRLERALKQRALIERKRKDPNYKRFDSRTALRKRIWEGKATEEDKVKYRILCEKNIASVRKYHNNKRLQKTKRKSQTPPNSAEDEPPTKKHRT